MGKEGICTDRAIGMSLSDIRGGEDEEEEMKTWS